MHVISPIASSRKRSALIIFWRHPFLAVENPASAIATALASFGYIVYLCQPAIEADMRFCHENRAEFELCILVGSPALSASYEGQRLYDVIGCKQYFWLLDPVFHDLNRVAETRSYLMKSLGDQRLHFLCPDRGTVELLQPFSPDRAWYFPFGGFYTPYAAETRVKRNGRIAIFATIGQELGGVRHGSLEELLAQTETFALAEDDRAGLSAAMQAKGANSNVAIALRDFLGIPGDRLLDQDVVSLICEIDSFEKRRRRLAVIDNLGKFPVDIYGGGWEQHVEQRDNFTLKGLIAHTDISDVMQYYSAVVNFDPNWDDGVHDRVFTALGSGCLVISNRNLELPSDALENRHIMTYDMNQPALSGEVEAFLAQPLPGPEQASRYRTQHNWIGRIDLFLQRHTASAGRSIEIGAA